MNYKYIDYEFYASIIYKAISYDAVRVFEIASSKIDLNTIDVKGIVNIDIHVPSQFVNNIDEINREFKSSDLMSLRQCSISKTENSGDLLTVTVPSEILISIKVLNSSNNDCCLDEIMLNSGEYTKSIIKDICEYEIINKLRSFSSVRYEISIRKNISEEWCENANRELSMSWYKCIRDVHVKPLKNGRFYSVFLTSELADKIISHLKI